MTLHEFIILMTLSIGTLGYNIRYTSEYIPKLQIHQQIIESIFKSYMLTSLCFCLQSLPSLFILFIHLALNLKMLKHQE